MNARVRYRITAFKSGHEEQDTVDRDLPCAAAGYYESAGMTAG
jgi:hypothetical protein